MGEDRETVALKIPIFFRVNNFASSLSLTYLDDGASDGRCLP